MFRSIGRGVLEFPRAIDTGNAIRHGVTPRAYPSGGRTAPSAAEASAIQQLTESDARP